MIKRVLVATVLAAALATGALAFDRGGMGGDHGREGMFGGGRYGRILQALDLTPDQKQKIQDIVKAHHQKFASLGASARAAHEALADKLFSTGSLAPADLEAPMAQATQARSDLMHEGLAVALEVRGVLTPAQIEKAASIRARMKALHNEMQQMLGNKGGGALN